MAEENPTPPVKARVVAVTDVGRVREHNEDSFLLFDRDSSKRLNGSEVLESPDVKSAVIMAVCDGMGGAAAGEVASRMAADRLADVLGKADLATALPDQIVSLLDQAVQQANAEILALSKSDAEKKGMGTTLTAAVALRGRLYVSQVGDSRAYLLRNGLLNQITKDQSLIGQLIEEGTLTEEEAEKYGARNIVLQAVGVEENLRVDTKHWPLLRGDVILLCSDGLSGMVKDAKMKAILTECGEDVRKAAERLIVEANDNGGKDNVTVIVARFDGEGLRAPMETSAGEAGVEKAGAEFKAPPPPEVPNPMKKVAGWGLAALAVVVALFYVFRPTTAELVFNATPAAKVVVKGVTDTNFVREVDAKDRTSISGLPFGEYQFVASAPHHYDESRSFKVEKPGVVPFEPVVLRPMPVTLVLTTKGSGISFSLDVSSPHPSFEALKVENTLPDPSAKRDYANVPAGRLRLVARRAGFRDHVVEQDLQPDSKVAIEVPLLEEITGSLTVQAPAGFQVRVLDGGGETLASGLAADGGFVCKVRVGTLSVVASKTGYVEFRDTVVVEEGKGATIAVKATIATVPVTFAGIPNAEIRVEVKQQGGWAEDAKYGSRFLNDAGQLPGQLPPGEYRVRYTDASKKAVKPTEFTVPVGGAAMRVQVNEK